MAIPKTEYARRRRVFLDAVGTKAVAVLAAAPVAVRSNDVDYTYRQDNDLLYLTGCPEPEAVCLLLPGHPEGEFVLFVQPRDRDKERWTGRRLGVEGAIEQLGADAAFEIGRLDEKVLELAGGRECLYFNFTRSDAFTSRVLGWMRHWRATRPRTGCGPRGLRDPAEVLHELRLIKSAPEIEIMRRAAAISAEAHCAAMHAVRSGMYEFEIEALMDGTFRRLGATGPAYPSIIAAGDNATVLHYIENTAPMRSGDLLLIDAGAEVDGYCADITRTFPIGATYTAPQRDVYQVVLDAQLAAIAAIRPGVAYDEPHRCAVDTLVDGLRFLKALEGSHDEILERETYKRFFMHRTGHWLGMDVHDVGAYQIGEKTREYAAGMVVTVEPGLYFSADDEQAPEALRGLGVRIEDDVLVTATGADVLTAAVPKSCNDIEGLRAQGR